MIRTRNRNAWIWVALAALTLASVARADSDSQPARAYAHPVLQFLAGSHATQPASLHSSPGLLRHPSQRQERAASRSNFGGAWLAMLPVFFIGLVSPLNQLSQRSILCLGSVPAAPLLPHSFQRPPPLQTA